MPLALAGVLAGTTSAALPPAASDRWVEARTPHFVIDSNAEDRVTIRTARRLERLVEVLTQTTRGMELDARRPQRLILFKDDASFAPYKLNAEGKPENISGLFIRSPDGYLMALDVSVDDDRHSVAFHEYTHAFLAANLEEIPLWLNEGLAEFFSASRINNEVAQVGSPISEHLGWLARHPLQDLDVLFGTDENNAGYHEGDRQGTIYAQSWALTHYLLRGMGDGGRHFSAFFSSYSGGMRASEAYRLAFRDIPNDSMFAALRAYTRRGEYDVIEYRFGKPMEAVTVETRELSPAEADFRLGEFLQRRGPVAGGLALDHLRAAATADSLAARCSVLMGRVEEARGNTTEADRLYARYPPNAGNPEFEFMMARGLISRAPIGDPQRAGELGPTLPLLAEARVHVKRGLERAPDDAEGLALLGRTYLFDAEVPSEAIAALTQSIAERPGRVEPLVDLVTLHANAGHLTVAQSLMRRTLQPLTEPERYFTAEIALAKAVRREADRLLRAGKPADADSLFARARAVVANPQVMNYLDGSRQQNTRQTAVVLYNEGILALDGRHPEQAVPLFEQARDVADNPSIRADAEARLAEAKGLVRVQDAQALARKGRIADAKRSLRQLLSEHPPESVRDLAESVLGDLP
jgi:tetratricopeptide (TPR) repeat protein